MERSLTRNIKCKEKRRKTEEKNKATRLHTSGANRNRTVEQIFML